MANFVTRAYNKIELNSEYQKITKISSEDRLKDEIFYYKNIPEKYKSFYPRFIDSYTNQDNHCMELEFYPYDNLGQKMFSSSIELNSWRNIADKISSILDQFDNSTIEMDTTSNPLYEMTITKTNREYNNLINNFKEFKHLSTKSKIVINNKEYDNFHVIWGKVQNAIVKLFSDVDFAFYHGDMCFSNILYCENKNLNELSLKLIDPRGSFGSCPVCYGNRYYDLAKLKHSYCSGYEYIIYDRFELSYNIRLGKIDYKFKSDNTPILRNIFNKKLLNNIDKYLKTLLVESCIYVGMCARHYDSIERQIIMYCKGITLMNEFLDIYEN